MKKIAFFATLLIVFTACGGGEKKAVTAACSPSGAALRISIKNTEFAKDCLAAPAGRAFTIELDNQDADTHNLAIYKDESAKERFFMGEIFAGPAKKTYNVDALSPGTYFFRCDVHPQTNGTFVVA